MVGLGFLLVDEYLYLFLERYLGTLYFVHKNTQRVLQKKKKIVQKTPPELGQRQEFIFGSKYIT